MALAVIPKFFSLLIVAVAATHMSSVGIRTSGLVLKGLVERAGFISQETWGAEKLELLVWLAEQVKENVKGQVKMDLALQDLNGFLQVEGMSPKHGDAKYAIEQLLALRRRELKRRGVFESDDDVCLDCLSESDVQGLFAVVPTGTPIEAGVKNFASSFTGSRAEQAAASGEKGEGEGTSNNNIEQSEEPSGTDGTPAPANSEEESQEFFVKYSPQWSAVMEHRLKSRGLTSSNDITVNTCDGTTLELMFHDGTPYVSAESTMFPLRIKSKGSIAEQ